MISGIQTIIYSKNAQADRAFFKDVLGFPADAGADGWLTFTLPPSELACLPAQKTIGTLCTLYVTTSTA